MLDNVNVGWGWMVDGLNGLLREIHAKVDEMPDEATERDVQNFEEARQRLDKLVLRVKGNVS